MKKKVVAITCVVAVVIVLAVGIFMSSSKNRHIEQMNIVKVDTVGTRQVITTVEATGTVVFRDKVSVYAKNSGKVTYTYAKEGDMLNAGDVIVEYDKSTLETLQRQLEEANLTLKSANLGLEALNIPTDETQIKQLELQITQSEKNISDIETNLEQINRNIEQATKDLEAAKALYAQGAISQSEYTNYENILTNYETQKSTAETNLEVSKQQLETNKLQYNSAIDKTSDATSLNKIASQKVVIEQAQLKVNQLTKDINDFEQRTTAPITGTVVKVYVQEGEQVQEGKLIAEMGSLNDLVIEADIAEYDMEGVAVGQTVTIESDATSEVFEGTITKIYPIAEKKVVGTSEKNVIKVEISMPQNTVLNAGYTADLTITTNIDDNATVIPIMAYMTQTDGDPYVFVVNNDGILEKRTIKIKALQSSIASVEGLVTGERVVSSPTEDMYEGMQIVVSEQDMQQLNNVEIVPEL